MTEDADGCLLLGEKPKSASANSTSEFDPTRTCTWRNFQLGG
jgi:hypothetical protein